MKKCFLLIIFSMVMMVAHAQNANQDVVYLKNGSIIRGEIVNLVPNETVKIKTVDGSVFAYSMDDVKEITKEPTVKPEKPNRTNEKRKGYIGISLGASIPMGNFTETYKGSTGVGAQVNLINFGYLFTKNFGVAATWYGAANAIQKESTDLWSYGGLMAGPIFTVPLAKRIDFDVRPMFGFSSGTVPNSVTTSEKSTTHFAMDLGTLIRFNVGKRIAILTNLDFFSSKITHGYTGNEWFEWVEQPISTFNIGVGIAYRLK